MSRFEIMRARDAGFTLIELLITLALLSLLTLSLFGSIRYGSRLWEASQASASNSETVRAAQEEIAGILAASYPKFIVEPTHASVEFDGEPMRLRVLSPDPQIKGGLDYVTFRTERTASGVELLLDRKLELARPDTESAPPEILLRGLRAFALAYFGAEKAGASPEWHDVWQQKTRPPLLVRIRAEFADHRLTWPELTVPLQITADASCTLDQITRYCEGR